MKGYQPIVGSRQLKKIYIPKPLSILQKKRLKSTSILSAATLLHRCHSILLRWQLLLWVPGLTVGPVQHGADHFLLPDPWLDILLKSGHQSCSHEPLFNDFPCNSQIWAVWKRLHPGIYWIKENQRNNRRTCTQWCTRYTCREQGWASCINKLWTVWILFQKLLWIENQYNKTPYYLLLDASWLTFILSHLYTNLG